MKSNNRRYVSTVARCSKSIFLGAAAVLSLLLALGIPSSFSQTDLKIPPEYGQIVYQSNEDSAGQVVIIGMSHRDRMTLLNDANTSKVQAEVYRIGDWYIRNRGIELLLPEGFFKTKRAETLKTKPGGLNGVNYGDLLKGNALDERLSDNRTFVNAEMLLIESHHVRTDQVEDKGLYDAATQALVKLITTDPACDEYALVKSEVDSLQDKRTAVMLQNIPGIIDEEFREGTIKSRQAIFTIGISHLSKIIQYLRENNISITQTSASEKRAEQGGEVNLVSGKFGISIVIPKTLLDDPKIMNMSGLDGLVVKSYAASGASPVR